jgi:FtsH-binding integral membrane protein
MGTFGNARPMDYAGGAEADYSVSRFMNNVYAWMSAGLALTAAVAWMVSQNLDTFAPLVRGPMIFLLIIAQFGLVFVIGGAVNRISAGVATALFLLYAALNGLLLAGIFLRYDLGTVASTFIVTAGMFGVTSVYGYVTKHDLTRLGSLMFMALIGLILATVVNIFWANSTLYWIINYAGVIIFVGLTAYDTQKLKEIAYQLQGDAAMAARLSISGALTLYLDFLNLFLMLLRILGDRR